MAVRIVLGTANFGTNYGFRGVGQKKPNVDFATASEIIAAANEIGITEIDTALEYGPSQKWVSELASGNNFLVNSKIIWDGANKYRNYQSSLKQILDELGTCNLHLLQWHNWEKGSSVRADYLELHSLLDQEGMLGFGVTTYGAKAVKEALLVNSFCSIQLEYNVLNQSALKTFLKFREKNQLSLYIRSVLLQGLLSDIPTLNNPISPKLQEKISQIQTTAREWNLSTQEVALRSVMNLVEDCAIVVGAESGQQLQAINSFVEKGPLPTELAQIIDLFDSSLDPEVDPRNWVL
ncbi:Tas Predicted oxidoreductases (related to aryl-alcohol dehydrogenases) [Candidatus Nanopelagicaceae bacterium]